jgi:hypothetical protein
MAAVHMIRPWNIKRQENRSLLSADLHSLRHCLSVISASIILLNLLASSGLVFTVSISNVSISNVVSISLNTSNTLGGSLSISDGVSISNVVSISLSISKAVVLASGSASENFCNGIKSASSLH